VPPATTAAAGSASHIVARLPGIFISGLQLI
jgi:hypothetical protein